MLYSGFGWAPEELWECSVFGGLRQKEVFPATSFETLPYSTPSETLGRGWVVNLRFRCGGEVALVSAFNTTLYL